MKLIKSIILLLLILIITSCIKLRDYEKIPPGSFKAMIVIESKPTTARIFVDDKYLGMTPIKTHLWFFEKKMVNVKAEPVYEGQVPQNIFIETPPFPEKLVIYMDARPWEDTEFDPKKKRAEEEKLDGAESAFKIPTKIIIDTVLIKQMELLPVVFFDYDKDNIKDEEAIKLLAFTSFLKEHPEYNVSINGYADERGSVKYNYDLALRRSDSVYKFLVDNGIDGNRLNIYTSGEKVTVDRQGVQVQYNMERTVNFKLKRIER